MIPTWLAKLRAAGVFASPYRSEEDIELIERGSGFDVYLDTVTFEQLKMLAVMFDTKDISVRPGTITSKSAPTVIVQIRYPEAT